VARSRRSAGGSRWRRRRVADATGLALGYLLDAAWGDPRRLHPVAGYGRLAAALERHTYAPTREAGARHVAIAVGVPVTVAAILAGLTRRRPLVRTALVAAATWTVLGGTSLRREAEAMAGELRSGDLGAARRRLPNLCGRDPSTLDESEIARATVESVAENTSDAVVGPLVWGAAAGLPGLVGYRAVNTLDAMIGHRDPRYLRFGTVAARTDDLVNLVPSRLAAALAVATAARVAGSPARAAGTWFRDGNRHPSPNSGQVEASFAGALGVRLGGRNVYAGRVEDRPFLGGGRPPATDDIERAARLSAAVGLGALALCAGWALAAARQR
jgi:adenosylcobinamide-phosphate synthase